MNDELRALVESMLESSRLLGIKEARKAVGEFTRDDARFVRAMHESIEAGKRKLQAALDAQAGGWLPIESAPRDGSNFFVARYYGRGTEPDYGIGFRTSNGHGIARDVYGDLMGPTHYMAPYAPAGPVEGGEG